MEKNCIISWFVLCTLLMCEIWRCLHYNSFVPVRRRKKHACLANQQQWPSNGHSTVERMSLYLSSAVYFMQIVYVQCHEVLINIYETKHLPAFPVWQRDQSLVGAGRLLNWCCHLDSPVRSLFLLLLTESLPLCFWSPRMQLGERPYLTKQPDTQTGRTKCSLWKSDKKGGY